MSVSLVAAAVAALVQWAEDLVAVVVVVVVAKWYNTSTYRLNLDQLLTCTWGVAVQVPQAAWATVASTAKQLILNTKEPESLPTAEVAEAALLAIE
jgi:hypothetical protein